VAAQRVAGVALGGASPEAIPYRENSITVAPISTAEPSAATPRHTLSKGAMAHLRADDMPNINFD
jgi:hypothetical protein